MNDPSPLEAIFFAALEKGSPQERAAYLDEACAADPDLRRRVVKMLAAQAQAGSFLEQPARSPVVTVDEQPVRDGPGTVIGPYKLLEPIGEGGFGVVFLAEQTQPLRRKVALKILKPGMDTRQVVARFEAERQALAILDHAHIAKVFDGGATPSGRPYFVMELVKGVPITDFCDQNHLTPRQRLELFLPVCQAVQHAHQKGIIHRDLKPSNILVSRHDTTPVVKVIDFGVAKALGQELTDKTLFTGLAQMIGTPLYMSPEQAGLSDLDVDTRSDVYSLGVLLYELLTGTTPFPKERFKQAGYDEIRRVLREEEPPRPSTRLSTLGQAATTVSTNRRSDPKQLSRLCRGELDWIVMKALEKDRNRRYESASAFAADVQRYLADEPVLACPPSAGYRLRKFVRRHKGPVLAASVIVFFLVAAIVSTTIGLVQVRAAERQALRERDEKDEARRQARQALNTMTDEVVEELLGRQVQLTDQHREFLQKVLAYHAAFAAAKAGDLAGLQTRAEGYFRVATIRHRLGQLKEAEKAYRDAVDLCRQAGADSPDLQDVLAGTLMHLGSLLRDTGAAPEAESAYREALAIEKQLVADFPKKPEYRKDLALTHYNLAILLRKTGRPRDAESAWNDALALDKQLVADFPGRADFRNNMAGDYTGLGGLLLETGRPKEAEVAWRDAVAIQKQLAADFRNRPEYRQNLAMSYNNLGLVLRMTGRPADAEAVWGDALAIQKQLAADFPNRPDFRQDLAGSHYNLAVLLHTTGRSEKAEVAWRDALALMKRLAADFPNVPEYQQREADTLTALATLLRAANRPQEAETAYREALAIGKRLVAAFPNRPDFRHSLALSHNNLGFLLYKLGRPAEAEAVYRDALTLWKQLTSELPKQPDIRQDLGRTYYNLGLLLSDAKRPAEAEAAYREALAIWRQLATESPRVPGYQVGAAGTLALLGLLLYETGRPVEGEAAWREALALWKRLTDEFPNVPMYQEEYKKLLAELEAKQKK
jgi:serine/threonine protein kinase/tetratricopeptide (TPR) repeat protein